jgi:transcriptional regulator with XRE-family HTH domain
MTDADRPLTLRDLIQSHQDRTGDSYSMLARRCDLSKAKIGQLATSKQNHMPRAHTLEQLSRGLNLPLKTVQQAAMASAGITPEGYPGGNRLDLIVANLGDLTPEDLETAAVVIQSLKDRRNLRAVS